MRFLYLGYPIDQAHPGVWMLVARVRNQLDAAKIAYYDPGAAFTNVQTLEPSDEVWKTNYRAFTLCEAGLFLLPVGVPTIGTVREIQLGVQAGMPVAVCTDGPSWSLPETGRLRVFGTDATGVGDAIRWLQRQEYEVLDRRQALPWTGVCTCLPLEAGGDGPEEDCPAHGRVEITEQLTPRRAYSDDAGLDLTVSESVEIGPREVVDIHCGIAVELPSHCWGLILGRSSTRRSRGLMVHPGVIDPGWRGELFINVENLGDHTVEVRAGERLGQLIVIGNQTQTFEPVRVDELRPSARGTNGFGSTGT